MIIQLSILSFLALTLLAVCLYANRKTRLGRIARLNKYNLFLVKYGTDSKQVAKFFKKYSKDKLFTKKAELMKKAELIKRNVMFSPHVERKLKNKIKSS